MFTGVTPGINTFRLFQLQLPCRSGTKTYHKTQSQPSKAAQPRTCSELKKESQLMPSDTPSHSPLATFPWRSVTSALWQISAGYKVSVSQGQNTWQRTFTSWKLEEPERSNLDLSRRRSVLCHTLNYLCSWRRMKPPGYGDMGWGPAGGGGGVGRCVAAALVPPEIVSSESWPAVQHSAELVELTVAWQHVQCIDYIIGSSLDTLD